MFSSPSALPLSRLSPYLCCRLAFDQRSHTLSRGFDSKEEREKRLDEVWRKRKFEFLVT